MVLSCLFQCVASNAIGFFLYIAAGSMVVWSYNFELDEDYDYREGASNIPYVTLMLRPRPEITIKCLLIN